MGKHTFKRKKIKHGLKKHPLYLTWASMLTRCYNPNHKHYEYYGGRGVTVCERWRESPAAFIEDMGEKPSPNHTLDRINDAIVYSKETCRWADKRTQSINKRIYKPRDLNKPYSLYRGVFWRKTQRKWISSISINKINNHLGCFRDEVRAARAYDMVAFFIYGQEARLNFPEKRAEYEAELAASLKTKGSIYERIAAKIKNA